MQKRTKKLFLVSLLLAVLIASIPYMALGEGKRCPLVICYGGCTCTEGEVSNMGPCCFECDTGSTIIVCCNDYYETGAYYDVCFVAPPR